MKIGVRDLRLGVDVLMRFEAGPVSAILAWAFGFHDTLHIYIGGLGRRELYQWAGTKALKTRFGGNEVWIPQLDSKLHFLLRLLTETWSRSSLPK